MEQIVLWSKDISIEGRLSSIELSYHGKPRVNSDEVDRLVAESYTRGREEATAELNEQILLQRGEVQQLIGQSLENLEHKVDVCLKDVFNEIPALVTSIARRVLADVEMDGEKVKAIVDDIIGDIPSQKEEIRIYLCDEDLQLLHSYVENLDQQYPHCIFDVDSTLAKADCRVVSSFGTIDGRVDTKLKHIEDQLHS